MGDTHDQSPREKALAARDALRRKLDPGAGETSRPAGDSGCGGYFAAANSAYDTAEVALAEGNGSKAREQFELGNSYTAMGEACVALEHVLPTPTLQPD